MPSQESVKGYLFPIAIGLLAGSGVTAAMMLLTALAAVKLQLALSGYPAMVWIPVCFGGLAAGGFGSGFAGERKGLCGIAAAFFAVGDIACAAAKSRLGRAAAGCVLLLTGAAGAGMVCGRRTKFKPGKARPRVKPRRSRCKSLFCLLTVEQGIDPNT